MFVLPRNPRWHYQLGSSFQETTLLIPDLGLRARRTSADLTVIGLGSALGSKRVGRIDFTTELLLKVRACHVITFGQLIACQTDEDPRDCPSMVESQPHCYRTRVMVYAVEIGRILAPDQVSWGGAKVGGIKQDARDRF